MMPEVKLPTYWPSCSTAQVSTGRELHLLYSLPEEVIDVVLDILEEAADLEDPYQHLKEHMLKTHVLSECHEAGAPVQG
jgi:hypothetical protein